ncbi:MAG: glycosyltransferase [Clostridiales bacterium]|nr:glycosyltransferase [Clostridiales bacterium]
MKKVSFIIPVYNCGNCLKNMVSAVEMMELEQFEIILVDDGSVDDSGIICDQLAECFKNIRVIHQENQGVSSARNRGIEMADGELILFLDADDTIESVKLQQMIHIMECNDTLDLLIYGLSFDYYYHGQCYRRDEMVYPMTGIMPADMWQNELFQMYLHNSLSSSCTKIFRKAIIINNHIRFNGEMFLYEDFEFVIRYLSCCDAIYNSEEIVYYYHQQEDEGNAKRRLKRIDYLTELVNQIEVVLQEMEVKMDFSEKVKKETDAILLHFYLVLAREKIAVSDKQQIKQICQDMSSWLNSRPASFLDSLSDKDRNYVDMIMYNRVGKLAADYRYTAMRHKLAVRVKNMAFYKRLKKK